MNSYYRNEYLFSEIYLEEITQIPEQADVLASLNTLKEYRDYADTSNLHIWKDSFVHQVLYALGFNIQVKNDNVTQLFPMGSTEKPISVCYILLPGENLDNTTMGRNWAEKIIRNLREHEMQWGLLTNGEQWRIYHQNEPTPYETYLEIDLAAILAYKAREAYQILHKFMRAENFTAGEDGQCQFDVFKKESQDKIDYIEKELENALKQKEEGGQGVLSSLCMAYVEELRRNEHVDLDSFEIREKVYHGAMLYMFRLLFLLYTDARDLMYTSNQNIFAEVMQKSYAYEKEGMLEIDQYKLWGLLQQVFVDIDQTYNGGLFNPLESDETRFIEETKIADNYLAHALYHLSHYQESDGQVRFISYRDMSVRQLGTLYEGLLEHKLYIAKEDTEIVITDNLVKFIPESENGKIIEGHYIKRGEIYFGSDLSERKSTGSYYTPEYIVDNIVKNTVDRKLLELEQRLDSEIKETVRLFDNSIDEQEKKSIANLIRDQLVEFIRKDILTIHVVDPAMGSGHFLVNTTNHLANFVTHILNKLDIEHDIDTGTGKWRRWIVENCIFGVDINPLAVELAKLILWILTTVKDQPLSFLKHHLKTGNSLVGIRLNQIGYYPGKHRSIIENQTEPAQYSFFTSDVDLRTDLEKALTNYARIANRSSDDLDAINEKKDWLEENEAILGKYKMILNSHINIFHGDHLTEWDYKELIEKKDLGKIQDKIFFDNYFNWELEFPEVFLHGSGFDIVLGNPPWGAQVVTSKKFFADQYKSNSSDSAAYFLEMATKISSGLLSFIVPKSISFYNSWKSIRNYLLDQCDFLRVMDVGIAFNNVNYESIVLLLQVNKKNQGNPGIDHAIPLKKSVQRKEITYQGEFDTEVMQIAQVIPFIALSEIETQIINNLHQNSVKVVDVAEAIYRGLYIPDREKRKLEHGSYQFINKVPDVKRYHINKVMHISLEGKKRWQNKAIRIMVPRVFFKVLRGSRLVCFPDSKGIYLTTEKLVNLVIDQKQYPVPYEFIAGVMNSTLPSYYIQRMMFCNTTETSRVMDKPYLGPVILPKIDFDNREDINKVNRITKNVNRIIELNGQFENEVSSSKVKEKIGEIKVNEIEIEHIVGQLFRLSPEERDYIDQVDR